MAPALTATDVAYSMAGIVQAVLMGIWLLGAWLFGAHRRASLYWAGFAGLSALSFALLTPAMHLANREQAELVRAAGNLLGVAAIIALHQGIRHFAGRPAGLMAHLLIFAAVLAASYVGLSPSGGSVRVGVNSGLLALLMLAMAADLRRYAREALGLRWPAALGWPLLLAASAFAFRSLRAVVRPEHVATDLAGDSLLNVASAFAYVVIALSFHATLMALVMLRLTSELRHQSRHDGLTGLLNRRAMIEALQAQIQRGRRSAEAFSVLMFDLDHFKAINDRFGHAAGDLALKHVAEVLEAGLREVDSLARIGGEEFLALMPGSTLDAGAQVAERLRQRLAASPVPLDLARVPLSVSIGIAQWNGLREDASRLLVRVDAALYQAKEQGRDRVVVAARPPDGETEVWLGSGQTRRG